LRLGSVQHHDIHSMVNGPCDQWSESPAIVRPKKIGRLGAVPPRCASNDEIIAYTRKPRRFGPSCPILLHRRKVDRADERNGMRSRKIPLHFYGKTCQISKSGQCHAETQYIPTLETWYAPRAHWRRSTMDQGVTDASNGDPISDQYRRCRSSMV
jgi:hypothetical protein